MSENQNKKPNPEIDEGLDAEWKRVIGNPDNLIVSDVLRSSLPDEFSTEENVSSILEVELSIGGLEVNGPLTRLDMSKSGWLCQMSVDATDVAVVLSYTLEEIYSAKVSLKDKGNTITTFEADPSGNLVVSVDTDGRIYYVTLTYENPQEEPDESR